MKRDYFIYDADGQGTLSELDLPVRVGGVNQDGIVIPGMADDELVAIIALADGHAYIQPARSARTIFHNDERLADSAWLKSGDRLQIAGNILSWEIQGDRVLIAVQPQKLEIDQLRPPKQAPTPPQNDNLPVSDKESTDSGKKQLRRSVVAFVSVLFLMVVYLLTTTSVVITAEPENAVIDLQGFPPAISFGEAHLALPGKYQLNISSPGYQTEDIELDIDSGPALELHYALTELPGVVTINTDPPAQLQLFVDGVASPANAQGNFDIARGTHLLRVESLRFLPQEFEIEVEGFGAGQLFDLTLERAWAVVSISTSPAGAEVLVDDSVIGLTPLQAEILEGQHEIRVQKPGFKAVTAFLTMEAGLDFVMQEIQLEPVDGRLTVSSQPAGASILDGDKFLGTTPATLKLAAETEHKLRFSKAGYVTGGQLVRLAADEERVLQVKLAAEFATLFLKVLPAGASLEVNGKQTSLGGGRLRLQTVKNTLLVSKPGYVSQKFTVTPQAGVSESMSVSLVTIKQQQAVRQEAATPAVVTTVSGQTLQLIRPESILHMGASRRDAGRRANENQRLVKLQRPFYIAHKEVTNAEFRRFMPKHDSGRIDAAALNGEQQPVVNVSWDDAARYCNWLSKQQELPLAYREENGQMLAVNPMNTGYRLPTEAEWAWVARREGFEKEQRYPWQAGFPPVAVSGNYADARIADTLADTVPAYDDGYRGTAPVGSFPAWPAGFYDMGGNVAEWMHDIYALYPGEASVEVTDPTGPVTGKHHVVRGAGWRDGSITELRLSFRDYSSKLRYDLGFRIARYAE